MFLSFSKYQGAGNDFIIIDDRAGIFPIDNASFISKLCHRRFGVGADGLLLFQTSTYANYRARIFNSDGKEVGMCGNGMRCFVHYLHSLGFKEDTFLIETMHDSISGSIRGDKISIKLERPQVLHWGMHLEEEGHLWEAYVVHMGVPHAVIFTEDLDGLDVDRLGRKIRHHPSFAPEGVNVNFAKMGADGSVKVRTYERGVEGETLSCGTGAAAVALTAVQKWNVPSPVRISPLSKHCLEVYVGQTKLGEKELELVGGAECVFEGKFAVEQFM
jgi:diaminopimelate epimerase